MSGFSIQAILSKLSEKTWEGSFDPIQDFLLHAANINGDPILSDVEWRRATEEGGAFLAQLTDQDKNTMLAHLTTLFRQVDGADLGKKQYVATFGSVPSGDGFIHWFLIRDDFRNEETLYACDDHGRRVEVTDRIQERAYLANAIKESGQSEWQHIFSLFEMGDRYCLVGPDGDVDSAIASGQTLMSRIANTNFPYEVSLALVKEETGWLPYLYLGVATSVSMEKERPVVVLAHTHPLNDEIGEEDGHRNSANFRPSIPDINTFVSQAELIERQITAGELPSAVAIPGFRSSRGVYQTAILSTKGGSVITLERQPDNQFRVHLIFASSNGYYYSADEMRNLLARQISGSSRKVGVDIDAIRIQEMNIEEFRAQTSFNLDQQVKDDKIIDLSPHIPPEYVIDDEAWYAAGLPLPT